MKFEGTKEEIEEISKKELSKDIVSFIEKCMKGENSESNLIAVLHMIQDEFGYLEEDKLRAVSHLMNIPIAKITGVASFYHYFKLKKVGKYIISVCLGTACHVKGADKLLEKLKEELNIELGETTEDGLFTLEAARCFGACALAPIVKVGDDVYPRVSEDEVLKILEKYSL
jgi:NADH:ubiquinone oxidoreductase subunit E